MSLFVNLARLADELASEGGRLKKRAAIADAIGLVVADRGETALRDAGLFALYLAGTPFPESDQRNLNAGGALLSKAIKEVSGASDAELGAAYRRHGDLGAAAFDVLHPRDAEKSAVVTLREVEEAFAGMAVAPTTRARAGLVEDLLRRATAVEAKYLLKLMLGDMRIGVKQSLVEEAIAVAASQPAPETMAAPDSAESQSGRPVEVSAVRHAVMLEADLAGAVRRAFQGTLEEARMRLFHPLGFMLASPVETPEEAVERFTAKPPKAPAAAKKSPARKSGRKKAAAVPEPEDAAEEFAETSVIDVIAAPVEDEAERIATSGAAGSEIGGTAGGRVEAFLEDKYDGMRAQLHCGDRGAPGRVAIYSRNRDEVTESFPELQEAFARVGAETGTEGGVILDGEILGWDFAEGKALPFAVLGQRIGRKRVSNDVRRTIPVVFMAFDLMYAGGELTLSLPLRQRRELLERVVAAMQSTAAAPFELPELPKFAKPVKGKRGKAAAGQGEIFAGDALVAGATGLTAMPASETQSAPPEPQRLVARLMISPAQLVETAEQIDQAYADARARANEGVMLKAAGSPYLPGRRGLLWVKLKRELATLDVVITGAEYGTGRRSQLLSDYTFAVRGTGGELRNVGKAYSGVTDQEILDLTAWLKAHTLEDFGHFRTVEPQIILEVAFNNIMRSDRHASGFALRFPRIVRIRDDKPLSEIDTVERVEEVYQAQVDKPADVASADAETEA